MPFSYNFSIRYIQQDDLEKVALIHQRAFPESPLRLFGIKAIEKYYGWQMIPPNLCYALGAFQDENLIGFCFAGSLLNAEVYFIKKELFNFFFYFLSHPKLWFNRLIAEKLRVICRNIKDRYVMKKKQENKTQELINKDRFGVLSIAVDPQAQHCGVGKALLVEVERLASSLDHKRIVLSVHPENQKAVSFYENLGWERTCFELDKTWQGYMHKDLK